MRKKRLRGRSNIRGRKGADKEGNIKNYEFPKTIPSQNQLLLDKMV